MDESKYDRMYEKLYRLFDGVTPLKKDCGVLCGRACCKGGDDVGMRLFPHEKTALRMTENDGARYAVCDGTCDRRLRPLSCRIFPFFPTADERGRTGIAADIRGAGVCPLARHADEIAVRRIFLRRMRLAAKMLAADAECLAFMREVTAEIEEAAALLEKMNGN